MWIYQGKNFSEEQIGDYVGFVYIITNLIDNRQYIGKKIFWNKVVKPPLKGKKRRRISRKSSDWKEYYGSGPMIKEAVEQHGTENFRREILRLCSTKSEMSYYETKEIFIRDAILREEFYNEWVSAKITGKFV